MSQVIIAGPPGAAETQALLTAAHSTYAPDRVVIPIDPSNTATTQWLNQHNPEALAMVEGASKEVCGLFCQIPPIFPFFGSWGIKLSVGGGGEVGGGAGGGGGGGMLLNMCVCML